MRHLRDFPCSFDKNQQISTTISISSLTSHLHSQILEVRNLILLELFLSLRFSWKQYTLHSEIKADNLRVNLNLQYSFARLTLVFIFLDKQVLFTSPCIWTADCICMKLIIQITIACKSPFGKWCPSGRDSFLCMNFWQHPVLHSLYCKWSRLLALQVYLCVFISNCKWLRKKKIKSMISHLFLLCQIS